MGSSLAETGVAVGVGRVGVAVGAGSLVGARVRVGLGVAAAGVAAGSPAVADGVDAGSEPHAPTMSAGPSSNTRRRVQRPPVVVPNGQA